MKESFNPNPKKEEVGQEAELKPESKYITDNKAVEAYVAKLSPLRKQVYELREQGVSLRKIVEQVPPLSLQEVRTILKNIERDISKLV